MKVLAIEKIESPAISLRLASILETKKIKDILWSALTCRHVADNPYQIQSLGIDVVLYHIGCSHRVYQSMIQSIQHYGRKQAVFLVSDPKEELTPYLSPLYCPNGVLFLPLKEQELESCLKAAEILYDAGSELVEEDKVFKVKTQGEYLNFKYNDIYFFEGQEKQIALRLRGQEIRFYSNFNEVIKRLDERFFRCHKGFIINKTKIEKVRLSDMVIQLTDGSIIPFSRTYAHQVKDLVLQRD